MVQINRALSRNPKDGLFLTTLILPPTIMQHDLFGGFSEWADLTRSSKTFALPYCLMNNEIRSGQIAERTC